MEQQKVKMMDTREYVSVLRELTYQGKEVSLPVAGNSMAPFLIHGRDAIIFESPKKQLKKGDMVFYQRKSGQFIMHRIYKISSEGYYFVGDAQTMIEGPLPESSVFALITKVQRKGKWIDSDDFWWKFFEKVWIRVVPLRPLLVKAYSIIKGRKNEAK